jgi:uncharacterized protein YqeY
MMSIEDNIKAEWLQARKSRDHIAVGLLSTLLGDIYKIGKGAGDRETTDQETISVVKKFIENNKKTLLQVTSDEAIYSLGKELKILEKFLPKQMEEQELRDTIKDLILKNNIPIQAKSMGILMSKLKETFGGQYDGGMASRLVKEFLS